MVGKNNKKEQLRKNATKNTRFSLKKLSVGVASVAVGASLLVGNVAHAEEAAPQAGQQQEQFLLQFVVDGVPQQTEAFTGTQKEFMEFQHSQAAARYSNAEFSRTWEDNKLVVTVTPKKEEPSVPAPKPKKEETKFEYQFVVNGEERATVGYTASSIQEFMDYLTGYVSNEFPDTKNSPRYEWNGNSVKVFIETEETKEKEATKFEYQFVVNGEERAAVGYTASSIQDFMDYLTGYINNEFPDTKESPRYEWDGNSVKVFIETENKVKEERKDYKLVFVVDGEEVLSADYENHTYEEFYANVAENLKNQEAKGRYNTKLVVDGGVYTYTFETRAQSGEPEKHEKDELPKEKILELYKEQTIKDLKARGFNNEFVFGAINKANTIEGIDSIVKELNLEPTTEEKLAQYKEKTINELKAKGFNNKLVFDIIRRAKTIEGVDSVVANLDLSDLDEEAGKKLDAAKAGALEDIAGLDYFTADEKAKLEDLVNEVESFDEFVEKVDKAISEAIEENDKRHKAAQSSEEKPGDKEEQKPGKEEQKPGKEEQKPGKEEQKPGKEEQKPGKEEQKPGQKESDKGQLQSAKDNAKGEIDKLPNLSDKQKGDLKAGLDKADSLAKVQEILDFARKLNKDQAPKQEDKKEEKKGQRLPDTATGAWALGLVGVSSLLAGAGVKKFKK
ncbi:albumin-binding GA domain-containing protein [Dolosigranulum pigrum]|uniref:albumin-binding GA domain-containing protein n=1 Tax=Dolosigranulum pigrum TaxID=29394 RepID=UPI001AD878AA|nr:albumin-binding GA domain-containing protein [Dolosigranulum pigrum]QTJ57357.1 YSIRK-type signal peptide-containing protein [Dolosigranulum pigrum]